MAATIEVKQTHADVVKEIAAVGIHEKKSRTIIASVAREVLAHAVNHGDNSLINLLVKELTPANRLAVVQLIQDCTLFVWDAKARQFKGTNKNGDKEAKDKCLFDFVNKYGENLWDWYEAEKAKENERPSFNAASLAKIIASYALSNNGSFEGLDAEITKAREVAEKQVEQIPLIEATIAKFVAMGMDIGDAKKQAQKMAKDGKLKAEPVEQEQAAA